MYCTFDPGKLYVLIQEFHGSSGTFATLINHSSYIAIYCSQEEKVRQPAFGTCIMV